MDSPYTMVKIETLERLEDMALDGAKNCPCKDKSDWIRIWVLARRLQGEKGNEKIWQAQIQEDSK